MPTRIAMEVVQNRDGTFSSQNSLEVLSSARIVAAPSIGRIQKKLKPVRIKKSKSMTLPWVGLQLPLTIKRSKQDTDYWHYGDCEE